MMLVMSSFGLIFGVCAITVGDGFNPTIEFLHQNPEALMHIFAFGCSSAVGQYLVLHTVRTCGPVAYVIMMTLRQIISIVVSAFLYDHAISWLAYACAGIAFFVVLIKPLAK